VRPDLRFEAERRAARLDPGGEARGVDRRALRQEEQVAARFREQLGVPRLLAGIALEILVRRELAWIDEDRGDYPAAMTPRLADQGEVPGMERAHGRDEGDSFARGPPGIDRRRELAGRADGSHPP